MDKIYGINTLVGILKQQVTRKADRKDRSSRSSHTSASSARQKASAQELDRQIVGKLNKLNRDEQGYDRKSMRIIVESILAWEFGDGILGDPDFDELVNKVTGNLESSDKLSALYKEYCNQPRKG